MVFDVVQAVRDGQAIFQWTEVLREHNGNKLFISVLRDAMKFDDVPAMNFRRAGLPKSHPDYGKRYDGVRVPASALELQKIADELGAMLCTPLVIEEIWLQAKIRFDAIINTEHPANPKLRKIVATSDVQRVHLAIEEAIADLGGDDGESLISCVGKYWGLINALKGRKAEGTFAACNFGWFWEKASGPGVTPRVSCWQRPGFRHGFMHLDPSQTIRLMLRWARLIRNNGTEELVDLHDVAKDRKLAPLLHHQTGVLHYLRQEGVAVIPTM